MNKKDFGIFLALCCVVIFSSCDSTEVTSNDTHLATQTPIVAMAEKTPTEKIQIVPTPIDATPTVQISRVHNVLLFDESFVGNELGWHSGSEYGLVVPGGEIVFFLPEQDESWLPQSMLAGIDKTLQIDGDCTIHVKIGNPVNHSGLVFNSGEDSYIFLIDSGVIGISRTYLSDKSWEVLGDIEEILSRPNRGIDIDITFIGDEANVFVNNTLVAARTDKLYGKQRIFKGFYVGSGDTFALWEFEIWGDTTDSLKMY